MTLKNIFVINLGIGVFIKAVTFVWLVTLPSNSQGLIAVNIWSIAPPMLVGALLIVFSAMALMGRDESKQMLLRFDAVILLVGSLAVLAVLMTLPFNGSALSYSWAWVLCLVAALVGYSVYVVTRAFGRCNTRPQESRDEPDL